MVSLLTATGKACIFLRSADGENTPQSHTLAAENPDSAKLTSAQHGEPRPHRQTQRRDQENEGMPHMPLLNGTFHPHFTLS